MVKQTAKAKRMAEKYGVKQSELDDAIRAAQEQVNAFDHPHLNVIAQGAVKQMRWGLIPSWVRSRDEAIVIQNQTLNARSETAFEKPSFRESMKQRRCVIPVEAFYEWQHRGKLKIPYIINPTQDEFFSIAGIYDAWVSPQTHTTVSTFSILTCSANPIMAEIHNSKLRMPVILSLNDAREWLSEGTADTRVKELAVPCPEEWLNPICLGQLEL